jgi:1-acyl-sn-glycerol-3-phosphate acyltransferase
MKLLAKIKGFYGIFVFLFFATIFVVLFLLPSKENYKSIRKKLTAKMLKLLCIKLETEGKIEKETNLIIINHSSYIDIPILEAISEQDLCWVAKKELFDIPIYGYLLKKQK